jgi:hypothetical protein
MTSSVSAKTRKILRIKYPFTRNSALPPNLKQANGVFIPLKNPDGGKINHNHEARKLANALRIIFPRETLIALRNHLGDI